MTRKDLIHLFAERTNLPPETVRPIIEAFFDAVVDSLATGERIEIRGFGVFQIQEKQSRKRRNPKSGETVVVAPTRTVKFKMGKKLRDKLHVKRPTSAVK